MESIYHTTANGLKVEFQEGSGSDVTVIVNGQIQQEMQTTWFMSALLEESLKLKSELHDLKKQLKKGSS